MTTSRMRGFTLLELLVSLMVFAVVVALVYGTVRIGSRSWQAGATRIEEADALRIGWSFVQRALSNSRPEPSLMPDSSGLHFIGSPSSVEFVADLPAQLGVGGLHVLSLQLDGQDGAGPSRLLLRRARLRRQGDADNGTAGAGRSGGDCAGRGRDRAVDPLLRHDRRGRGGGGRRWHAQWQQQPNLPTLVMVTVQLEGGMHWPLLVAHPRRGDTDGRDASRGGRRGLAITRGAEEAEPRATVD